MGFYCYQFCPQAADHAFCEPDKYGDRCVACDAVICWEEGSDPEDDDWVEPNEHAQVQVQATTQATTQTGPRVVDGSEGGASGASGASGKSTQGGGKVGTSGKGGANADAKSS